MRAVRDTMIVSPPLVIGDEPRSTSWCGWPAGLDLTARDLGLG